MHFLADVRLNRVMLQDLAAFRQWYGDERIKLSGKPFKFLTANDTGDKSGAKQPANPELQERDYEWAARKKW